MKTNKKNKIQDLINRKVEHIHFSQKFHQGISPSFLVNNLMNEFDYEPMIFDSATNSKSEQCFFLDKEIKHPFLISSMTAGPQKSLVLNQRLARLAAHFQIPMGLGSCRPYFDTYPKIHSSFLMRKQNKDGIILANIGIAQIEEFLHSGQLALLDQMVEDLECDALIIHVNLLQELFQDDGDSISSSPLALVEMAQKELRSPLIVKEVGQGFGPRSLKALLNLNLAGVDFSALGGTNFSQIEMMRQRQFDSTNTINNLSLAGHDLKEMIENYHKIMLRDLLHTNNNTQIILSGGIKDPITALYYYLKFTGSGRLKPSKCPLMGLGWALMEKALKNENELFDFMETFLNTFYEARKYLYLKSEK